MKNNILIFCVDEMRADHMGCAGNKIVKTPNLDKLAESGTYFPNAYCNNPICMPARATMFTGLLPRDHGVRVNGQTLCKDIPTLPGILADNGYRTHATGKLHLTPWVPKQDDPVMPESFPECIDYWNKNIINEFPTPYYGFNSVDFVGGHTSYAYGEYINWLKEKGGNPELLTSEYALEEPSGCQACYKMSMPEELHYNRYIADSTIDTIKKESENPFFIWCSFPDPHLPCAPPQKYSDIYKFEDMPLPSSRDGELTDLPPFYADIFDGKLKPNGTDNTNVSNKDFQEIIAMTYGMITHIDNEIGRVMDVLKNSGKKEDTIVVFIADHGDMMGDHGLLWKAFYTFKGCTNIPLIVSAPNMQSNNINKHLISQIDLMPGILDLVGLEMPEENWKDNETPFQRGCVMSLNNYPGQSFKAMLANKNAKIRDSVVIENDDPTTGFHVRTLITDEYRIASYPGTDHGELFNIKDDPKELYNLWYKKGFAEVRNQLIAKLLNDYSLSTPYYPIPPWNS